MQTVFAGDHLRAYLIQRSGDRLILTFDHHKPGRCEFDGPGFHDFFDQIDASQIIVRTRANDWFLNPDLPAALAACGAAAREFAYVICYGFSMGAYGAMIFSRAVAADRVVAVSPQFSVDPRKVPFEKRWLEDTENIDFSFERFHELIDGETPAFVIHDPSNAPDAHHARLILEQAPRWTPVRLFHGGHPAASVVHEAGRLNAFGRTLLGSPPDRESLEAMHRDARRHSASYWASLARRAKAKRPELSAEAVRRGLACDPARSIPQSQFYLAARGQDLGLPGCLERMEKAALDFGHAPARWFDRIARVKARAGRRAAIVARATG
jgi:hypothetical protein